MILLQVLGFSGQCMVPGPCAWSDSSRWMEVGAGRSRIRRSQKPDLLQHIKQRTNAQTHKHINAQTHKRTSAQTRNHTSTKTRTQTHRHTNTQTHKHASAQTHANTRTQTNTQAHKHTSRQAHGHTRTQATTPIFTPLRNFTITTRIDSLPLGEFLSRLPRKSGGQ